jgi:hypothetical protein
MAHLSVPQCTGQPRSSILDGSFKPTNTGVHFRSSARRQNVDPAIRAVALVAQNRPAPLREFDQIPMREQHLLEQSRAIASPLAGTTVAFVGDYDCTSLVLGMLGNLGNPRPARMVMLDFDERLLTAAVRLARRYGFPSDLAGQFDWFYTNPPYGSHNVGASGRLFISRGCELTSPVGSHGCIILPYAPDRPWTAEAMRATQQSLVNNGWVVREARTGAHQYYLDDDPDLPSSAIVIDRVPYGACLGMPYTGRHVEDGEIATFYGRTVIPPYPHYIRPSGAIDCNWNG